jgi:hypothetical protein
LRGIIKRIQRPKAVKFLNERRLGDAFEDGNALFNPGRLLSQLDSNVRSLLIACGAQRGNFQLWSLNSSSVIFVPSPQLPGGKTRLTTRAVTPADEALGVGIAY